MLIMAIDPGGDTGYVVGDSNSGHVDYGELHGDHHRELYLLLASLAHNDGEPLQVICERFDKRDSTDFARLISVEYIGVVKLFEQQPRRRAVRWQGSDVKHWATNAKLKQMGLLLIPSTKWVHANDAMRHLVHYVCHYMGENESILHWREKLLADLR